MNYHLQLLFLVDIEDIFLLVLKKIMESVTNAVLVIEAGGWLSHLNRLVMVIHFRFIADGDTIRIKLKIGDLRNGACNWIWLCCVMAEDSELLLHHGVYWDIVESPCVPIFFMFQVLLFLNVLIVVLVGSNYLTLWWWL